jgi:hypothetical protein
MKEGHVHDLRIFADYHQFYIWDAGTNPLAPVDYTDDDLRNMVKVAPHVVVIEPMRNMMVPVLIEVHDTDPGWDPLSWDHAVECSVDLPTGHLQVHECTGSAQLDLRLPPGTYRVRVLFAGLDSLSASGLEGDDRYVALLWPGDTQPLRVLKLFTSARGATG